MAMTEAATFSQAVRLKEERSAAGLPDDSDEEDDGDGDETPTTGQATRARTGLLGQQDGSITSVTSSRLSTDTIKPGRKLTERAGNSSDN